jgi:two-component system phosphate regulon sensor histidine kinase PhoR
MVIAIAATACAAGLVFYLQHRAIAALQAQTRVILGQISELTAADVAQEMRQTLDGPVFETLTAVNHPDLQAGRLDLVAEQFERGLAEFPHVERFFAWHARTHATAPGEVVFYGRGRPFVRDPDLGRAIVGLAHRYAPTQQIYVAAEEVGPGRHLVFLRLFWVDARRRDYFAILGFVVDPAGLGERLFEPPHRAHLDALVARRGGGDVPLQVRVKDDGGRVVLGTSATGTVAATQPFSMLFYPPDDIQSRLAAGVTPRPWTIEVVAPEALSSGAGPALGYWPTLVSIGLMLVALAITVEAYRRSQELAAMQADFVSHVSHQLKTPLSALSAATETLQLDRVRSPEKRAQYLGIIATETARLSSLVQRVLEFSRVQQPRRYEFQRVDLGTLARETVEAFSNGLSGPPVVFRVDADGPGPIVRADPAALEQVLVNLLDNAVKYSDRADVTIRVREAGGQAVVEVADRGVGIAPSDQARIFERFYRGSASSRRQGFGLGLPIVRELVRAHGGRVSVTSTPGSGSTFSVTLPSEPARPGDRVGLRADVREAAS